MHGIVGHGKQVVATRQAQRAKVVVQALPENRPVVVTFKYLKIIVYGNRLIKGTKSPSQLEFLVRNFNLVAVDGEFVFEVDFKVVGAHAISPTKRRIAGTSDELDLKLKKIINVYV